MVIATPDHWHAIQMIEACKAGKDVYVEKPLSMTIAEGRAMVEAARRHDRIVQVGTHRRSSRLYMHLAEVIRSGAIGKITVARAAYCSNMATQGIGHAPESEPPADLDWDLWLGPRPARPFQATIMPYKFRWWQLYSSQVANWGVHYFDLARWLTGELAPASVSAHGGRFAVDDDRTIPDTTIAIFEHASGMLTEFCRLRGQRPARAGPRGRSRAPGHAGHDLCQRSRLRDRPRAGRPVPGCLAPAQAGGRESHRRRSRPAGGARLSRQRQEPQAAYRRRRGRAPLDHLRPPGEHRTGHPQAPRMGRPGRAILQL